MQNKLAIAIIMLLPGLFAQAQSCLPGGITFTTQAQVDNFQTANPGCTMIEGALTVQGANITNLNNLSVIQSVGGDFLIVNNDALTSLNGLNNLTTIGGAGRIQNNPSLTNIDGLQSLTAARGDFFYLSDSPLLTSLSGLGSLDSVAGIFQIWEHPLITDLSGLENLTFVGAAFAIFRNANLESLDGLENLATVVGDLRIYENDDLSDLAALDHPINMQGALVITDNPNLSDCEVEAVCNYVADPVTFVAISGNDGDCASETLVLDDCLSPTSEAELQARISIAPNPVADVVRVSSDGLAIEGVQIRDIAGRLVYQTQADFEEINLGELADGVYFFEIFTEDQAVVKRLVKQ